MDEATSEAMAFFGALREDAKKAIVTKVGMVELSARDYDNRVAQMTPEQVRTAYAKDPDAVMQSIGRMVERQKG